MNRPRDFNDVLSKTPEAKQSGDHWIAPCPLAGHKTPAGHLTLKDGRDKALITCQGGRHSYQDYCQAWGFDSLTYSRNGNELEDNKQKTLVNTFSYECEKGKEAYQIRRFNLGNGNKTFEAWHKKDGKYVLGMGENKPILYHLPEIPDWIAATRRIYLPEGELKADFIISKGGAASTSPFGAGRNKWHSQYSRTLAGAEVIVLPDNDKPGSDFAQDKAASLYGNVKSVKVLKLPGLPEKGDIINWFNVGGTFEQLEPLASEAPEYKPNSQNEGFSLVCMADVKAEAVSWLWQPYIPKGKLTLLEGDPGVGKSWVSLAIATAVSLGNGLPGVETTEPQSVLLASAEDGLGDTIRPRLDAMRAGISLIQAIQTINEALTLDENGFDKLENYLEMIHPALLIIDPLVAYLGVKVDIFRANESRHVMARLARMAEKFNIAILAIRHLTKGGMAKAIYRGSGSIDFTAACRSVLLAGSDPGNPQKCGLVHIKSNLAPKGQAIGYELRNGGFYWTGESDLTAGRILAAEESGEGRSAIDDAVDFLKDELVEGAVETDQIKRDADAAGVNQRTLRRARESMGVKVKRQGEPGGKRGGGRWLWQLPESLADQDDLADHNDHIRENGQLNQISPVNYPLPKTDGQLNPETVLRMPVEKVIEMWRSESAPVIHLGPGENCFDLAKLLSNRNVQKRHLEAVKTWLEKRN